MQKIKKKKKESLSYKLYTYSLRQTKSLCFPKTEMKLSDKVIISEASPTSFLLPQRAAIVKSKLHPHCASLFCSSALYFIPLCVLWRSAGMTNKHQLTRRLFFSNFAVHKPPWRLTKGVCPAQSGVLDSAIKYRKRNTLIYQIGKNVTCHPERNR